MIWRNLYRRIELLRNNIVITNKHNVPNIVLHMLFLNRCPAIRDTATVGSLLTYRPPSESHFIQEEVPPGSDL